MKITSHGAAEAVTGSCHLLEVANEKLLIDCGLFQGGAALEARNLSPLPFDPASLSQVLLTHAHLDHCGRLPLLVKHGFTGPILATAATVEIAKFILLDAAHVMHEDFVAQRRRGRRRGEMPPFPPYDEQDVLETISRLTPIPGFDHPLPCGPRVQVTFRNAGHILGSAFLELEVKAGNITERVTFSGDLGNPGRQVVPDYDPPHPCDLVYCESTYGDRQHRDPSASQTEFAQVIGESLGRGGNVVIPSFALERSQDVLFELKEMHQQRRLPQGTRVFLNSPLAINITRIYRRFPGGLGPDLQRALQAGDDPFSFAGVEYVKTEQESRQLNELEGRSVFIAGSGMCNGGRVVHHLKHNLWRPEASVVLVGYQAKDTLGRLLVERRPTVRIHGEDIAVRAQVYTINGFSAHADQAALLRWLEGTQRAQVRLVHGEANGLNGLQSALHAQGRKAEIAKDGVAYEH